MDHIVWLHTWYRRKALALLATLVGVLISFVASAQTGGSRVQPLKASASERQLALVIGNASYPGNALRNPVNDARAVARALRAANFEVFQHLDASAKEMRRAIANFSELINREATVVFYFAGHGLQAKGRNFLIPTDAEIKRETAIRAESIDLEEVMEQVAVARTSIIILDACRNNPFERRFRAAYSSGLAQVDAPKGTLIAYATSPGRVALDGDDASPNSIYTTALLDAMSIRGLRIEETFKRVRQQVTTITNDSQIPWESSSLTGEFCFGGCNATNPLAEELERAKREREAELTLLKREKDLLANEKALAEKQRQLLEQELRSRSTQQQSITEKLEKERDELTESKKKLLDEYEKRLAAEVSARTRAEEEVKQLGSASGVELAKVKREKDLLANEMALAEKKRQILENELRDKSSLQQALSDKLQKERDALTNDKSKILEEYERRLASEVAARARAEDEAKRLGTASTLALAKLKREKDLLANEMALSEKQRQILENELRAKTDTQQELSAKLQQERTSIASEKSKILEEYEKRLAAEVAARARAEDEAKRLGSASSLELAKLKREKELLLNEKALAEKQRQILENELRKESSQQHLIAKKLQEEKDQIALDRQRILLEYEKKLADEAAARAKAEDEAKRLGQAGQIAGNVANAKGNRIASEGKQDTAGSTNTPHQTQSPATSRPAFVPPMY
jgi:uncharacterized caspase-like protein